MTNPDFRRNTAAVIAALVLAGAILAAACILPELMISRLWKSVTPVLQSAKDAAALGDFEKAGECADTIAADILKSAGGLKLFFGHKEVSELCGAAGSAAAIAGTGDAAQLLQELCMIETTLDYLLRINEAGIDDIF